MAFLYMDPLSDHRRLLTQEELLNGRARLIEWGYGAVGSGIGIHAAFAAFGLHPKVPTDARIARVIREIERSPASFGRIQEAASLACLSPSRFRARFEAEVGLNFRRYRLWRRMAVVMRAIAAGSSLTDAALDAGFSSSAHLSSAFKRMFGLSASTVLSLGVVVDASEDDLHAGDCAASLQRAGRLKLQQKNGTGQRA